MRSTAFAIAACLCACVPTLSASSPRFTEAMDRAAQAHVHGRVDEEARAYRDAINAGDRRADRDEAEYRLAMLQAHRGQTDDALSLLDALSSHTPAGRRTVRAIFEAAQIRLALGDAMRATSAFEHIIITYPDHGVGSHALRILLSLRSHDESTLRWLEGLYASGGKDGDIADDLLFARAELLVELGRSSEAEQELERLVTDHPYPFCQRWDDAFTMLADLAEARGDARAAITALERMLAVWEPASRPGSYTLPRMPAAALRIARLQRDALRDLDAARASFDRVARDFADSTVDDDALYEAAELERSRGRNAQACDLLDRAIESSEIGRAHARAVTMKSELCE